MVFAILVYVLELFEGLDDVDIIAEVDDNVFGALVQTVVQDSETLFTEQDRESQYIVEMSDCGYELELP